MPRKSTKKKGGSFISGALMGAALGVAVGLFANTKTGKKVTKEVKSKSADFYKFILPELKKAKKMGKREYNKFIDEALLAYQKARKIKKSDLQKLAKEVKSTWGHFKKHL